MLQNLEQKRNELKKQLEDFVKQAQSQIDRLAGAIAMLDELIEEEKKKDE